MNGSGTMAPKKKAKPVRIAHELSRNRRRAIQKALAEPQVEDRTEHDLRIKGLCGSEFE